MDYQKAGVNIDQGNLAVSRIQSLVKKTFTPNVLGSIGGFSGFFELPKGYESPVLVSCTDGVGTKLKIAIESGIYNTIGVDLVAMCVNDLICSGAKPLTFLDYIACHKIDPVTIQAIIEGMSQACIETGTALIGGEMAEMNDLYLEGDFDLAGFSVGIVEKDKIIDGSNIAEGQLVYGLPSSGLHSNGFSLVRRVLTPDVCRKRKITAELLLTPTRLYVNEILSLIQDHPITGIAHITGGGLIENVDRVLPKHLALTVDRRDIPVPDIFNIIQAEGNVQPSEMERVFNMGIGMVVISESPLPLSSNYTQIGTVIPRETS